MSGSGEPSGDGTTPGDGPMATDTQAGLVIVCETDGTLREWGDGVRDVTGLSDETLAGGGLAGLVAEGNAGAVVGAVETAAETGTATETCRLAGATESPFEFRFGRWERTDGDARVVGVGERQSVADLSDPIESVLDRMTDAFFAVDDTWEVTYVNDAAREVLESAMADDGDGKLVGETLWDAVPGVVDTAFQEAYERAMATQEPTTLTEYYAPLDSHFEVRAHPSDTGLSVYFRDVTEHHHRKREFEQRTRVLQTLYEVTADREQSFEEKVEKLLWIGTEALDIEYGTLSRVEGDEYVFEVVESPDDTLTAGERVPLSVTSCERVVATEQRLALEHMEQNDPARTERADDAEWHIACYLGAPVVTDGEVYGTFCFYDEQPRTAFTEWEQTLVDLMAQWVGQELTRKRVHERLQNQNEQLESFASVVSHDLRNPLNVVAAGLQLAEANEDWSELERCYNGIERIEGIIDNCLALARAGTEITERESVSLARVARTAWETVETPDATLCCETDQRLLADESRLRQLLENLFRNAVEHGSTVAQSDAPEGAPGHESPPTTVTVTVTDRPDGFAVADDGPGIPADDRERVFETGYTTGTDGTGLGLAIVEQVADAHDWAVSLDPDADGACFVFDGVERPSGGPA